MKIRLFSIFILPLFTAVSCQEPKVIDEDSALEQTVEGQMRTIKRGDVEIIILDGCEYIIFKDTDSKALGFGYMAHKGNCINMIHQHKSVNDTILIERGNE